jgi:hypothetical protein
LDGFKLGLPVTKQSIAEKGLVDAYRFVTFADKIGLFTLLTLRSLASGLALLLFQLALFLPIPIFPLYWNNEWGFSAGLISVGTAVFHAAVLLGSLGGWPVWSIFRRRW